MKKSRSGGDDFITVARILKPQGRRGEVAVELLTDFPEEFSHRRHLNALSPSGERKQLQLEDFWAPVTSNRGTPRLVMKFAGIDSISAAEKLAGCQLQIGRGERVPLEPGSAYATDLIGCAVFALDRDSQPLPIGLIDDVTFGAGEAPLLVLRDKKNRELMVPFAAAYIQQLDLATKRLVMQLPEGMLALDAPLTPEEKQQQHKK